MTRYQRGKERARREAMDWAADVATRTVSYGELAIWQERFERLGGALRTAARVPRERDLLADLPCNSPITGLSFNQWASQGGTPDSREGGPR